MEPVELVLCDPQSTRNKEKEANPKIQEAGATLRFGIFLLEKWLKQWLH